MGSQNAIVSFTPQTASRRSGRVCQFDIRAPGFVVTDGSAIKTCTLAMSKVSR